MATNIDFFILEYFHFCAIFIRRPILVFKSTPDSGLPYSQMSETTGSTGRVLEILFQTHLIVHPVIFAFPFEWLVQSIGI